MGIQGQPTSTLNVTSRRVVTGLAGLLAMAILMAFALQSYLRIDVPATLSFPGSDGWCPQGAGGFGQHCWGDYSAIRFESLTSVPLGPELVYPLATRLVRIPFFLLDLHFGFEFGLAAFVIASIMILALPLIWATWHLTWLERAVIILVAGVATGPFLIAVDRGNIVVLIVPTALAIAIALRKESYVWVVALLVLAIVIKPQFALLTLLLIAFRKWLLFGVTATIGAAVYALSPLLMGFNPADSLITWLAVSYQWTSSGEIEGWPVNAAFSEAWLTLLISPISEALELGIAASVMKQFSQLLVGALATFALVMLSWRGRKLGSEVLVVLLLAVSSLSLPIAYGYYLAFALVAVAFIVRPDLETTSMHHRDFRLPWFLMSFATILSLTPLIVPAGEVIHLQNWDLTVVPNMVPLLASLGWFAVVMSYAVTLLPSQRGVSRSVGSHSTIVQEG